MDELWNKRPTVFCVKGDKNEKENIDFIMYAIYVYGRVYGKRK